MAKVKNGEIDFDEMLQDLGDKKPTAYSTDSSYSHSEFIEHKVFGVGRVVELITPNKIVVRFRDGKKILICTLANDY